MDFTTTTWLTSFTEKIQTIKRTVDGFTFTIVYDGERVTINDFPVTVQDWKTVISGKTVTLRSPKGTAKLTYQQPNILFNGHSLTGRSIKIEITMENSEPGRNNPGTGEFIIRNLDSQIKSCQLIFSLCHT